LFLREREGKHTTNAANLDSLDSRAGKIQQKQKEIVDVGRKRRESEDGGGGEVPCFEGQEDNLEHTASVEILGCDSEAEEDGFLPPLSCGRISGTAAVAIDESESDQGQVLLLGGWVEGVGSSSAVRKVDLASGVCTPQTPSLLSQHGVLLGRTAARLADGRIVCVGRNGTDSFQGTAQVLEPPPPELGSSSEASWQWRYLPDMSVGRSGSGGCVLSDGRFAVFGGGTNIYHTPTTSCEVLTLDGDIEQWDPLPPMREARKAFECAEQLYRRTCVNATVSGSLVLRINDGGVHVLYPSAKIIHNVKKSFYTA
jgi:hypothetical protein